MCVVQCDRCAAWQDDGHRKQFLTFNLVEALYKLLDTAVEHGELVMNISRILSKLTLHEDCRARMYNRVRGHGGHICSTVLIRAFALSSPPLFFMCADVQCRRGGTVVRLCGHRRHSAMQAALLGLLKAFDSYPDNLPLGLRLSFILGNLTTSNDACREMIHAAGAVDSLLDHLGRLVGLCTAVRRCLETAAPVSAPSGARKYRRGQAILAGPVPAPVCSIAAAR